MRRATADADALDDALLARLALEHEAVWLLGVVGARNAGLRDRATDAFVRHRRARERLLATLRSRGADPVPAQPSYGLPPSGEDAAVAAVADLERRISAACLRIVGAVEPERRPRAVDAVRTAALASMTWGAGVQAFPGLDEA